MNKWEKRFLWIACASVVVSFTIGTSLLRAPLFDRRAKSFSTRSGHHFPKISAQPSKDRSWKQPVFTELWRFSSYNLGGERLLLSGVFKVRTDTQRTCFALDRPRGRVLRVSTEGKLIGTIGKGPGEGPGQFANVTDFAPDCNGRLWIADGVLYRVSVFDVATGVVVKTLQFDYRPHRVLPLPNGNLVVHFDRRSAPPLAICNRQGKVTRWFGQLFPEQLESPFAAEGWLAGSGNRTYCAFLRVGLMAGFTPEGELVFLRKTVDEVPPPRTIKKVVGGQVAMWVDPSSKIASLDISADAGNGPIYVLSGFPRKGRSRVVDVYSPSTGSYTYSFRLPTAASGLCVRGDYVWAACDTAIVHYRVDWGP